MLKELLFNTTQLPLLKKGLDAYALRHRAISDNIANAETPGYRRKVVKFEEKLDQALADERLRRTHGSHLHRADELESINAELARDEQPSDVSGVNNVDIDREMTSLAENTTQYTLAAHLAKMHFEMLNQSIRGV
jgi:flagellar basal-body rod protein FlgB